MRQVYEEDCKDLALPMSEDIEVVPVIIDVTDDAKHDGRSNGGADDADVLVISVLWWMFRIHVRFQIQSKPEDDGWQFISCDGTRLQFMIKTASNCPASHLISLTVSWAEDSKSSILMRRKLAVVASPSLIDCG